MHTYMYDMTYTDTVKLETTILKNKTDRPLIIGLPIDVGYAQ